MLSFLIARFATDCTSRTTVGSTASGNSLTKTASTAWGNAGASSTRSIVSGDGYVEFKVTSLLTGMVALSHTDANQDYTSMEFALLPNSDGNLYVFESGVNRGIVSELYDGGCVSRGGEQSAYRTIRRARALRR